MPTLTPFSDERPGAKGAWLGGSELARAGRMRLKKKEKSLDYESGGLTPFLSTMNQAD